MFNSQPIYSFGQIQTCQTGGQPNSDTSPYEVNEYSLPASTKVLHGQQVSFGINGGYPVRPFQKRLKTAV